MIIKFGLLIVLSQFANPASSSFADRYYIHSVLSQLFGPAAHEILVKNVLKNGNVFGGPCDMYEEVRVGDAEFKNSELSRCFKGKQEFGYPMHSGPSLLREAWMIKNCHSLVNKKEAINHFQNSTGPMGDLNSKKIYEIQLRFDPNAKMNIDLNDYILKNVKNIKSKTEKLKRVVFEVCTSPHWQLI